MTHPQIQNPIKRIEDFIQVLFSEIRPAEPLPLDFFVYLEKNRALIRWRKAQQPITTELLEDVQKRGIPQLWIRKADLAIWQAYLAGENPYVQKPIMESAELKKPTRPFFGNPEAKFDARTEEGALLKEILANPNLTESEKTALLTLSARELVSFLAKKELMGETAPLPSKDQVRDILDLIFQESDRELRALIEELWTLCDRNESLSHLRNVTIYSVLFAISVGDTDDRLLIDMIAASLVHDIGFTQIPAHVAVKNRSLHTPEETDTFALHVKATLSLLQFLNAPLSDRSRDIIHQHHEHFGGTGYPRSLNGFQIFESTQKVSLADTLDSIASGRWDGRRRTIREAFKVIESLESRRGRADLFDPELTRQIHQWVHSDDLGPEGISPAQAIRNKLNHFLKRPQASPAA